MSDPEFLCVRCARHMKTCCQTCEIYVSPGDVERISAHTGRRDFYEFRAPPMQPMRIKTTILRGATMSFMRVGLVAFYSDKATGTAPFLVHTAACCRLKRGRSCAESIRTITRPRAFSLTSRRAVRWSCLSRDKD